MDFGEILQEFLCVALVFIILVFILKIYIKVVLLISD